MYEEAKDEAKGETNDEAARMSHGTELAENDAPLEDAAVGLGLVICTLAPACMQHVPALPASGNQCSIIPSVRHVCSKV